MRRVSSIYGGDVDEMSDAPSESTVDYLEQRARELREKWRHVNFAERPPEAMVDFGAAMALEEFAIALRRMEG